MLEVCAMYRPNSAGAACRKHCFGHLVYIASVGDPYAWFYTATNDTGDDYYDILLVYTDILAVGVNTKEILTSLRRYYSFKQDSTHPSVII
jgi:hypothetical protein